MVRIKKKALQKPRHMQGYYLSYKVFLYSCRIYSVSRNSFTSVLWLKRPTHAIANSVLEKDDFSTIDCSIEDIDIVVFVVCSTYMIASINFFLDKKT